MEEEDKSEVAVEKETDKESEESVGILVADAEVAVSAAAPAPAAAAAEEEEGAVGEDKEVERGLLDLEGGHELLQVEEAERWDRQELWIFLSVKQSFTKCFVFHKYNHRDEQHSHAYTINFKGIHTP